MTGENVTPAGDDDVVAQPAAEPEPEPELEPAAAAAAEPEQVMSVPAAAAEPEPAAAAEPEPELEPAAAAAAAAEPEQVMSVPARNRRDRALGTAGQVVGVVGIVVSLLLVVGVIFGRGWAIGTVDDVSGAIDAQIAKTEPLLSQASVRVGEISGRVGTVADLAAGIAADPSPGGAVAAALRAGLLSVGDRYQTLRTNYAEIHEAVVSMVNRLQTLDRLVPGFEIPQGPIDVLAALDERLQAFDAKVVDFIIFDPGQGPVNLAAAAVAEKVGDIEARLDGLLAGIAGVEERIATLRVKLIETAGAIETAITLGSIVSILLLLYLAFLNWVLFQHSGEIRRRDSAA